MSIAVPILAVQILMVSVNINLRDFHRTRKSGLHCDTRLMCYSGTDT